MLIVMLVALVAGGLASAGVWLREVWRGVPQRNQDFDFGAT